MNFTNKTVFRICLAAQASIDAFILFTLPQAIEEDQQDDLEAAVKAMKESTVPSEHVLDVCDMVPDPVTDPPFKYPVTLLAFAGYHARFDMLDFLIEEGARKCGVCHSSIIILLLYVFVYSTIATLPWTIQ